jgi:transcriptional regulator with XRE-family HTH domain
MKPIEIKIKELRLEKGWTLREAAKKFPMSFSGYSNLENGKTPPPWDRILQVAKIYEISLNELINSESVTNQDLENQHKIDDLYDILNGVNKELKFILEELYWIKKNI